MTETIDVVVRFHDLRRIMELELCVFSLASQTYRPVNIILATQRFTSEEQAQVQTTLAPLCQDEGVSLEIVNWSDVEPKDARTALFQIGTQAARGRYLAFLDYDDVLYPEAYATLIQELHNSATGIAFASVRVASVDVFRRTLYIRAMDHHVFEGKGLADLMKKNFCPLHSYVIDRSHLPRPLEFDVSVTWEEDYAMLLQIVSQVPSSFDLLGTEVGLYAYKTDGSNSVPTEHVHSEEQSVEYEKVKATMQALRKALPVSEAVQKKLRLKEPNTQRSISDVITLLDKTSFLSALKRA